MRSGSGHAATGLPPQTISARRLPASISSTSATMGSWCTTRGTSGRLGGPGRTLASGFTGRARGIRPSWKCMPSALSSEPLRISSTQRSQATRMPSPLICTPVPAIRLSCPGCARMSARSRSSSSGSTSAATAARSSVNGAERDAQGVDLVGIAVMGELVGIGAVGQELAGQRREHRDVTTGTDRQVRVGERGALGVARIEHPHACRRRRGTGGGR